MSRIDLARRFGWSIANSSFTWATILGAMGAHALYTDAALIAALLAFCSGAGFAMGALNRPFKMICDACEAYERDCKTLLATNASQHKTILELLDVLKMKGGGQ